jgi:hypothetical protein
MCHEMDEEVGRINRGGEGESGQVVKWDICVCSQTSSNANHSLSISPSKGGEMIELMRVTGGFHSAEDMANACNQPGGLNKAVIARMLEKLKGGISSLLFSAVLCCVVLCTTLYCSAVCQSCGPTIPC